MARGVPSICLILALLVCPAFCRKSFQSRLPNGDNVPHPCRDSEQWPGVGHKAPQGKGELTVFGQDFRDQGLQWTETLCRMDSDGDGMTNGQELGDPGCIWSEGQIPSRVNNITNPGVCDPYYSEQCQGKNDFLNCDVTNLDNCDKIRQPGVSTVDLKFKDTTVPPVVTSYYCMTFDLSTVMNVSEEYHIIADGPLINNSDVAHHMLLYGCQDDSPTNMPTPEACGMAVPGCYSIIGMWAVGATGTCFSADAGFRIGGRYFKKVAMQFHWNNPGRLANQTDASGTRLFIQPVRAEVQDLATFWVGQRVLEIPPGEKNVVFTGSCPGSCTSLRMKKSAYVINVINHAHYLGHFIKIEQFRNGTLINLLSSDPHYLYDSPVLHVQDPPVEFMPGDDIRITCAYSSMSSDRYAYYGDGTDDEMCIGFILAYPADAFYSTYCASHGLLSDCELRSGTPVETPDGVCNWAGDVVGKTSPKAIALRNEVAKNCNIFGFCRPECRRLVDRLRQHPCFQGQMAATLAYVLEMSPEGIQLMARMNTCPVKEACYDQCVDSDWCPDYGVYDGASGTGPVAILVVVMATLTVIFP